MGYGFHAVSIGREGRVTAFQDPAQADLWINGGYFILRREILDIVQPGEELVEEPFARLAAEGRLATVRYDGFWAPVDTLRDVQRLETYLEAGHPPWAVWQHAAAPGGITIRAGGGARPRLTVVRR